MTEVLLVRSCAVKETVKYSWFPILMSVSRKNFYIKNPGQAGVFTMVKLLPKGFFYLVFVS